MLQGVVNLSREVGAQSQTDGQTAAAVDVSHTAGDAHLLEHVDAERTALRCTDPRQLRASLQTVSVQLVGSQFGHRCVVIYLQNYYCTKLLIIS